MNENIELEKIEINPKLSAQYSVIWLHGLGADGHDFVPIVPELNLPKSSGIRFIFPHAPIMPVTLNNGYAMRAWFDIYGLHENAQLDEKGIAKSIEMVEQLIREENALGIPTDHIILAGFSQGAAVALISGVSLSQPVAGIIGLSGFLPPAESILNKISHANKHVPIFLAHGSQDQVVYYRYGEMTRDYLQQAGYDVTWRSYPIAHSVCPEEIHDIGKWIGKVVG